MAHKTMPREEMLEFSLNPRTADWLDASRTELKAGRWSYAGSPESLEYLGLPNPRQWSPADDDWKLPPNWMEILHDGMHKRLGKYRSFKLFMDICVRCGACADKCHFFLGGGDPKNMPVMRAELMRSIYRKDFTLAGKLFGKIAGARPMNEDVLKEWFYYFYQCTECRRCSVFCPYGIDTAEITMMARELMNELGVSINWITKPAADCQRTGNHLGVPPHAFKDSVEFASEDIKDITGLDVEIPIMKKGAEVLFVMPSADYAGNPHYYTMLGYFMLLHECGLEYTVSAYASEGGNFGLFHSTEMMRRLNGKIYAEAKRLGVKWILGGECGHMWRVLHQYMDTLNGPADFLEVPRSPITGTVFENARTSKVVHICEFTADLIQHGKIKLDPSRNDHWTPTFHDSCNPARALGLLEEPRYILRNVSNKFVEMPEGTTREQTFCCGAGSGLGTDENMEMRLRGGMPRGNALRFVKDKHGVNIMTCICAIDKATLPALADYWAGDVEIGGVHELVGNALVMTGEQKRTMDLRMEPLPDQEADAESAVEPGKEAVDV
ncbi:MAG: (Fe-S)-binding protein [Candidatus Krumholzibacteriia bacterium]